MIPVEFFMADRSPMTERSAGWFAMPQVPSIGETIRFAWFDPSVVTVVSVEWDWAEVPREAQTMVAAGLASIGADDHRLLARVGVR